MKKHINRNFHRLTVHLVNLKKENKFVNTYTFKDIPTEGEARNAIRIMLQNVSEDDAAMQNRIRKAYYNGKEFIYRTERSDSTANGWIIK